MHVKNESKSFSGRSIWKCCDFHTYKINPGKFTLPFNSILKKFLFFFGLNPESLFCTAYNSLILFRGENSLSTTEKGDQEFLLITYPINTVLDSRMHVRPD